MAHCNAQTFFFEWESLAELNERLEETRSVVEAARMETHFPKTLGWIWRFKVDEGIYIGAKNIALDELSGKFDVSVKNGKVWFSIKDGIAAIRAYHKCARGVQGTLLRLISSVLSREEVFIRVVIECAVSVRWNPDKVPKNRNGKAKKVAILLKRARGKPSLEQMTRALKSR